MPRSYARNVDANQAEIVEALRGVGASVLVLNGIFDLLVGFRNRTFILDVKNPLGKNRLTDRQEAEFEMWCGDVIAFPRSVEEALAAIGLVPEWEPEPSYQLVKPSGVVYPPLSTGEVEDRLDRLRPHTTVEG